MPTDANDPRPSLQDEAQRLAGAARERATDVLEEIKLNSNQLVDKVRELIEEGNVRRIAVKKGDRTIFEIPLTVGAGAAAAVALFNPLIAGIGAVAALISEVTLVIHREGHPDVDLGEAARDAIDDATTKVKDAAAKASGQARSAAADAADTVADAADDVADAAHDAADETKKTVGRPPSDDAA